MSEREIGVRLRKGSDVIEYRIERIVKLGSILLYLVFFVEHEILSDFQLGGLGKADR